MGGSTSDGPAAGPNTRWIKDAEGNIHETTINPESARMSFLLQESLNEALTIIEDLLAIGEHEGECTNIDTPEERCTLHWEAEHARWIRANDFLAKFHPPTLSHELMVEMDDDDEEAEKA
jgi:hypothetical protein